MVRGLFSWSVLLWLLVFVVGAALSRSVASAAGAPGKEYVLLSLHSSQIEVQVDKLLRNLTLAEKIRLLAGDGDMHTRPVKRLGIPVLKMSDASVGVHDWGPTTAYPASVALAATWNTRLAFVAGRSLGRDARARGVNIVLGPGMDITREPQCGRNFEYLGEDPYLAGHLAAAWIRGLQSMRVAACAKHYAGNEQETDRGDIDCIIGLRALHEIYLPPFRDAVRLGHVMTIMCAYNKVNGHFCSANHYLLTTVLRQRWGFKGLVMSDWGAVHDTLGPLNAGLDLEMPNPAYYNKNAIEPLLRSGRVKIATINRHVRRLLRVMVAMHFLQHRQKVASIPLNDPKSRATALKIAAEGTVLLKNKDGILPLPRDTIKTIVVVGPNATPAVTGGGGSSYTTPIIKPISMLAAIHATVGPNTRVIYLPYTRRTNLKWLSRNSSYLPIHGRKSLQGGYYTSTNLAGRPVATRLDKQIHFAWGLNHPVPQISRAAFSAQWVGKIRPLISGKYIFSAASDGASRVFLNGKKIIDMWHPQPLRRTATEIKLFGGRTYRLRVEYYNNVGKAQMYFGWGPLFGFLTKTDRATIRSADAVVACVGFSPKTEHEGADRSFHMPYVQGEYLHEVGQVNPHTIVVVNAGGNVAMSHWIHQVDGLLFAWYPGENGNTAVAKIIFGGICPGGRLPDSFEKHWRDSPAYGHFPGHHGAVHFAEGIYVGYRWFDSKHIKPRYCFGYGLSYTTFAMNHMKMSSDGSGKHRIIHVSINVTNTGRRAGAEVVQLYVRPPQNGAVRRTFQQLKGFARVELKPGQTRTVRWTLHWRDFAYFDVRGNSWRVPPGSYGIAVGSSSRNIAARQAVRWL